MVARGTGLDAARAGEVCRQSATDGPVPGDAAQHARVVHGFERELLALGLDQGFDLGQGRRGVCREHELLGLVERDAGERR